MLYVLGCFALAVCGGVCWLDGYRQGVQDMDKKIREILDEKLCEQQELNG